jgi:hypothetical protein
MSANNWERFETLAARAHEETGPPVEVTARVLHDIHGTPARPSADLLLWLFSGLSLTAASIVALLATQSWAAANDPLSALFDTLTMVMQ